MEASLRPDTATFEDFMEYYSSSRDGLIDKLPTTYNLLNAFTAASAVTCALAGLAPVTILPSVSVKAAKGVGGAMSIFLSTMDTYLQKPKFNLHFAPAAAAADSIVGLFHDLMVSNTPS